MYTVKPVLTLEALGGCSFGPLYIFCFHSLTIIYISRLKCFVAAGQHAVVIFTLKQHMGDNTDAL